MKSSEHINKFKVDMNLWVDSNPFEIVKNPNTLGNGNIYDL